MKARAILFRVLGGFSVSAVVLLGIGISQAAPSSAQTDVPDWVHFEYARVDFQHHSKACHSRESPDFYRLNEDGIIMAGEVIEVESLIAQQFQQEIFSQLFSGVKPTETDPRQDPANRAEMAVAALALNRILDHEALRLQLPRDVSAMRVDFVVRSVLAQNAVESGKVPTAEFPVRDSQGRETYDLDGAPIVEKRAAFPVVGRPTSVTSEDVLDHVSEAQLFFWLKERVDAQATKILEEREALKAGTVKRPKLKDELKLNVDWSYRANGLDNLRGLIQQLDGWLNWPKDATVVRFKTTEFPADIDAFRSVVFDQLNEMYARQLRQYVWQTRARQRQLSVLAYAGLSVPQSDIDAYYDQNRETVFKTRDRKAQVLEVVADSMPSSQGADRDLTREERARRIQIQFQYRKRLGEALEAELQKRVESFQATQPGAPLAMIPGFKDFVTRTRAEAPLTAMAAIRPEFAKELEAGVLRLSTRTYDLELKGLTEVPGGDRSDAESLRLRMAFPSRGTAATLVPKLELVDRDSRAVRMNFLSAESAGDEYTVEKTDTRVLSVVRDQVVAKRQAYAFRELAAGFLVPKENAIRLELVDETCSGDDFPCLRSLDTARAVRLLFPEKLYDPTAELKTEYGPVDSTFGNYQLLGSVREISLSALAIIFGYPDRPRAREF